MYPKPLFSYLHHGYISNSLWPLPTCHVLIDFIKRHSVMLPAVWSTGSAVKVFKWPNQLLCFVLASGFITMTPQLFINYKMKSVAHLPWRMLTYKALNTFIDDLFAFVIKMPMMYRIGCLRDGTSSLIEILIITNFSINLIGSGDVLLC